MLALLAPLHAEFTGAVTACPSICWSAGVVIVQLAPLLNPMVLTLLAPLVLMLLAPLTIPLVLTLLAPLVLTLVPTLTSADTGG